MKKIWEYVKSNDLQDPSNKRIIICDEKLEAVFRRKRVDCFQMNKYLVDHLAAEDEAMETSGHEDVKSHRSIDDVKSHRSSEDVKVPSQLKTMLPQLPTKVSLFCVLTHKPLFRLHLGPFRRAVLNISKIKISSTPITLQLF